MSQNEVTAFRRLQKTIHICESTSIPNFQKTMWWSWQGSNLRPSECKSDALPTELQPQNKFLAVDQVGLRGLEPRTSSLSGMRSNHLSYKPKKYLVWVIARIWVRPYPNQRSGFLLRKEVIQPHLPVRLPCYDLALVTSLTFDGSLSEELGHRLRVLPTSMAWRAVCTRPGNVFTAACWSAITSDSCFIESSCRL